LEWRSKPATLISATAALQQHQVSSASQTSKTKLKTNSSDNPDEFKQYPRRQFDAIIDTLTYDAL